MATPVFTPPRNPSDPFSEPLTPQVSAMRSHRGNDLTQTFGLTYLRTVRADWQVLDEDEKDQLESFFTSLPGQVGPFLWRTPEKVPSPIDSIVLIDSTGSGSGAPPYTANVQITWFDALGETKPSTIRQFAVPNDELLRVTVPVFPLGVSGWRLYWNLDPSAPELIGDITTSRTFLQAGALLPSGLPPTENDLFPQKVFLVSGEIPKAQRSGDNWRFSINLSEQTFVQGSPIFG